MHRNDLIYIYIYIYMGSSCCLIRYFLQPYVVSYWLQFIFCLFCCNVPLADLINIKSCEGCDLCCVAMYTSAACMHFRDDSYS